MSEKLAIHNGKRTVPPGFIKPWPEVTDADRQVVMEVLSVANVQEQQKIQSEALAKEWAEYMGMKYCIPVNSGTAALHMCVAGVGIEPGDEVIVPAFTFWASAAAVLHHNAIPVFADIDNKTYTLDPKSVKQKISDKTKALIPVHLAGMVADMSGLKDLANDYNLYIIEDACQSIGSKFRGKKVGSLGDIGCFSF